MTKIEWCDKTVNPVVGCTYGCDYCYARKMNQRFGWIEDFSNPQFFGERLKQLSTKKPTTIFINSMSDIADWGREDIISIASEIYKNPHNIYLALTKRPDSIGDGDHIHKAKNLWFGQTITNRDDAKIHRLVDFLSVEPLLEEVKLDFENTNVKWVIIGAETGNRKGKVVPKKDWVDEIVLQCFLYNIPVFMKNSLLPIMGEDYMHRERCPLEKERGIK